MPVLYTWLLLCLFDVRQKCSADRLAFLGELRGNVGCRLDDIETESFFTPDPAPHGVVRHCIWCESGKRRVAPSRKVPYRAVRACAAGSGVREH